jgi:hypothetical protein
MALRTSDLDQSAEIDPRDDYRDYSDTKDFSGTDDHSQPSSTFSSDDNYSPPSYTVDDGSDKTQITGPGADELAKRRGVQAALRRREQGDSSSGSAAGDLGAQEAGGFNTDKFYQLQNSINRLAGIKSNGKPSFFKRKGVMGLLIFLIGGAGAFAGFTAISGPMQLVQAAEVLRNATEFLDGAQTAARTLKDLNLMRGLRNALNNGTISDRIQRNRMGIAGNMVADRYIASLGESGITLDSGPLGTHKGMTIDLNKAIGGGANVLTNPNVSQERKNQYVQDKFGLPPDKFTINANGTVTVSRDLSMRQARQFISAAGAVAKFGPLKVPNFMSARITIKRMGKFNKLLHPFDAQKEKLIRAAENKLNKWMEMTQEETGRPLSNKVKDRKQKENAAAEEAREKAIEEIAKEKGLEGSSNDKIFNILDDDEKSSVDKAVSEAMQNVRLAQNPLMKAGNFLAKAQLPIAIISAYCLITKSVDEADAKAINAVNDAASYAERVKAAGGQVQAGDATTGSRLS